MALNDLNQMFSIVDPKTGKPTDYLMRLLRDRGIDANNIEDVVANNTELVQILQASVDAISGTVFNALSGLAGGGTLGTDDPINYSLDADIDDLNDVDTTTTPPTPGQALVWNDTDSLWNPGDVSSGGGGGGGVWELIGSDEATTGTETSLEVTGISNTYVSLKVLIIASLVSDSDIKVRFNNNSGSNYRYTRVFGGSSFGDDFDINTTSFGGSSAIFNVDGTAGTISALDMDVYGNNRSDTSTVIAAVATMWDDANFIVSSSGRYDPAEVIQSVQAFSSVNMRAGAKLLVYGLKESN